MNNKQKNNFRSILFTMCMGCIFIGIGILIGYSKGQDSYGDWLLQDVFQKLNGEYTVDHLNFGMNISKEDAVERVCYFQDVSTITPNYTDPQNFTHIESSRIDFKQKDGNEIPAPATSTKETRINPETSQAISCPYDASTDIGKDACVQFFTGNFARQDSMKYLQNN